MGIISLIISLLSLLPSDRYYRRVFGEIGRVDALTGIWVILCSVGFLGGVLAMRLATDKFGGSQQATQRAVRRTPELRLLSLATLGVLLNAYALFVLVRHFGPGGFLNALQGISTVDLRLTVYYVLKNANIGWALAFTVPIMAVLSTGILRLRRSGRDTVLLTMLATMMVALNVVVSIATQSKGGVLSLVMVIVVALLLDWQRPVRITAKRVLGVGLLGGVLVGFAATLQARRGLDITSMESITREVAGYVIVGFNRLAYLMQGRLDIPNMDVGFWTNRWYWGLPGTGLVNEGIVAAGFDVPTGAFDSWLQTFQAVRVAGLDPTYIWVTIFGEVYADYRWWGLLWFVAYGAGCQWLFSRLGRGSLGVHALYAWVAISNLQWYSGATATTRGLLFGLLIMAYLSIPIRPPRRVRITAPRSRILLHGRPLPRIVWRRSHSRAR